MQIGDSPLAEAGRRYFSAENAKTWISLLRPAFHLREPAEGEPVVSRLGGAPLLPPDVEWPAWDGHGPLSFVASVDCDLVPADELDIPLPGTGTLNFFYYNAVGDDAVDYLDPDTIVGGTRVVYVPAGAEVAPRRVPDGLAPFPETLFGGEMIATAPDNESAALVAAYGGDQDDPDAYQDYPTTDDGQGFWDMLTTFRRDHSPHHQIGGYALPKAGNVEKEAAHVVVPGKDDAAKAARQKVASQLVLLAQIDSDSRSGMEWGDTGRLYWLIQRDDLEARRFDRATFTWQSE
jgi:uncharacterized protein YwqG